MREKLYKKCPRCGEKTFINAKTCDNCKLVFARMEFASNKKAKQEIKAGRGKDNVIKSRTMPKDINRWKLLLICLFGGLVGAHNIYIGRYIKGFFSMFFILLTAILVLLVPSATVANAFNAFLFIPAAAVVYFWFYDMLMIGLGKYKIPVALDMPSADKPVEVVKDERK